MLPAARILRRDAGRTTVGVTGLRLDAAEREHEAARRVAPVGAEREQTRYVDRGDDLAACGYAYAIAQIETDQRVVHDHQRFTQWHADVIGEFERRRAGAAFLAVDDDEIRQDSGRRHRLGDAEPFPRMTERELETGRLAAGQLAQARDETQQTFGRVERRMPRR